MCARRDPFADLGEVQIHCLEVGVGQHERRTAIACRADGTEDVGPVVAAVARCRWPAAAFGPNPGQSALLADTSFILPTEFNRLALSLRRDCLGDQINEVFLCVS